MTIFIGGLFCTSTKRLEVWGEHSEDQNPGQAAINPLSNKVNGLTLSFMDNISND